MINEHTKKQLSLYILGLRKMPLGTPEHILEAAQASKTFFKCLNDDTKTIEDVFTALFIKHQKARNFSIIENTPWLW